ncbi:hypothetical protein SAMN05444360_11348 [Chryseobacterium carnipullorum]|nr:hypothetical protein SAMN05444360_11348 [Chryseobacterium carnipullorum]
MPSEFDIRPVLKFTLTSMEMVESILKLIESMNFKMETM